MNVQKMTEVTCHCGAVIKTDKVGMLNLFITAHTHEETTRETHVETGSTTERDYEGDYSVRRIGFVPNEDWE